jgi:plastocyanin
MKPYPIHLVFLGFILTCGGTLSGQATATVEGNVKLPKARTADVINKRYEMTGESAVVMPDPPSAVVYLEGEFMPPKALPEAQMAQKNLEFVTSLLPVEVGTKVSFPNLDDVYHNIFSYSKPKRFDLGRYRSDEKPVPTEVFDTPGVVVLHCDIHENMRAIILVLETPYFKRTDLDGTYKLGGLPAGHYKLKAWLDSKTTLEHEVDLKSGATLHIDFP